MLIDALDIKRLRAFQLVAKNGSLRIAATRLNQTIPAISLKIRRLERALGVELFERLPNKLILTVAGTRFLREVDTLFDNAEQALRNLATPEIAGRFAVSMGSDHSWYFAPRISKFLNNNPRVELSLQVHRAMDAIAALQRGDLDIAFGIFPNLPRGLEKATVVETTLALLCPAAHPMARQRLPKLSAIAAERLILPPLHTETRKIIDRTFAKASSPPTEIIEVANCATAQIFVEHGVGLALVHTQCLGHAPSPKLRWVDLGRHFGRLDFCIAYRKGGSQSTLLTSLLNELSGEDRPKARRPGPQIAPA